MTTGIDPDANAATLVDAVERASGEGAAIEAVDTVADPDPLRHARETAIYR